MEPAYRAATDVTFTELGDGTGVLLHLGSKFYFSLNATGVAAWRAIGTGASRTQIAEEIAKRFRIDADTAARDVEPLLREMLDEGLIARLP